MTWFVDYDSYHYESRMVVELYECGGGLVKTQGLRATPQ